MPAALDRPRAAKLVGVGFVVYGVVLALIAFAPEHVDRSSGELIELVLALVPGLTYDGLEFGANVLLFVPFGVLAALVVRPRAAAALLGLIASSTIETVQNDFLVGRTGSTGDVIANSLGALVGAAVVMIVVATRRPSPAAPGRWSSPAGSTASGR